MRHLKRWFLVFAAVLVTSSLFGCNTGQMPATTPAPPTTDSTFRSQVGIIDDMNTGLSLKRIESVAVQGFPTPSPNYISLLVLNHTSEPIRFADVGFGIEVFEFNAKVNQWSRVKLPYTPDGKETVIPAKLETLDFGVLNTWDISPDDLVAATSNEIRIFVSGIGTETEKRYGAFLDVELKHGSVQGSAGARFEP